MLTKTIIILILVHSIFSSVNIERGDNFLKYEGYDYINHGLSRCFGHNETKFNFMHLELRSLNKTNFLVALYENHHDLPKETFSSRNGLLSIKKDLKESYWQICLFNRKPNHLDIYIELNNYEHYNFLFQLAFVTTIIIFIGTIINLFRTFTNFI